MQDDTQAHLAASPDPGPKPAFGAPGFPPRWTSSTKDVVGTAYSASSRVWYTISHGILNECYYPTIDRPQIRDMELLFTDGVFFHEEKRDFTTQGTYIDGEALAVEMVHTSKTENYRVIKRVFSDPHYPSIVIDVRLEGDEELLKRLRVFALMAPHLEGGGAGNNARVEDVVGQKVLYSWKGRTSLAMGVNGGGFCRASCGYVGTSDGWQDLHDHLDMRWQFSSALDGNIAVIGEIDVTKRRQFTAALSFGDGEHGAMANLQQTLSVPADAHLKRFIEQWHRVTTPDRLMNASADGGRLLRISHNMLLAHEDKTFAGAFIASASIPWGQVKGDEDLGGYHLVWTRDMVQTATALLACNRHETARRALVYLACSQRSDGSFPQNFWVDGTPYWGGIQLDETAFPLILGWRLWKEGALGDFDIYTFAMRAASYLVRQAPVTQQERWEEAAGYSPSTLAAVIAALICAAEIARHNADETMALFLEEFADWTESHLEDWCVTSEGTLHPDIKSYYIRIRPPQGGEPYAREDAAMNIVHIANRAPGEKSDFEAREIVDGGFLELVRYGIRSPHDKLIQDTVTVIDAVLKRNTPAGPVWRRYNHDGYGNGKDGEPFVHYGQGHCWPLLGGERAHYEMAAGRDTTPYLKTYEQLASPGGMLPEQVWDGPELPEKELFCGKPTGSAMPLVWAHAEYIKLLRSRADGKVFDCIPLVQARYAEGDKTKRRSDIAFFKLRRHAPSVPAGGTLRIISGKQFQVTWSNDAWQTVNKTEASAVGLAGWFCDLPAPTATDSAIVFTLYWPQEQRWEGVNFTVPIHTSNDGRETDANESEKD